MTVDGARSRAALPTDAWSWNTLIPDAQHLSVPEALGRVVDALPEHPAIIADGRTRTYAEVGATTRQIAHALLARGTPGDPVSVVAGHGATPTLALFGALAAGMVCCLLDAREPQARIAALHQRFGARLVLTDRAHREIAETMGDAASIVVIDDLEHADASDPGVRPGVDDAALVIFTSGSTGTPKGVVLSHGALVQLGHVFGAITNTTPDDRVAIVGTYSFAATVFRVFGFAVHGATGVTFDLATTPVRQLPGWVDEHGVSILSLVPSVLRELCASTSGSRMPSVRFVLTSGDTLYGSDVLAARRRFASTSVMNRFGSTESGAMSILTLGPDDPVPDGPLPVEIFPWIELRLEDDDGTLVAPGDVGRIVVIGSVPALAYWRDPEATAARFLDLPDGRRGVRLDDIARLRPDGLIEHIGRWDDRLNVHGALVHPAEVERALAAMPGIAEAAVVAASKGEPDAHLVAYAVAEAGVELRGWEVRRDLATRLPTRMVPTSVVIVDELPRTSRGKLDRSALPSPPARWNDSTRPSSDPSAALVDAPGPAAAAASSASVASVASASTSKRPVPYRIRDLARLYGEVLGVDDVGPDDDFFELGGDSMASLELAAAVEELFGVDIGTSVLLAAPTPALLAERVVRQRPRGASPLFELRAGSGAPFVCVAGGGGHALAFHPFADALDDRPVLVFQARGLEEPARPDYSVEAIARRNLRVLGARAEERPLVLGGFSFGGLVAHAMSRQLQARGAPPALLVLFDSSAPSRALASVNHDDRGPSVWTAGSPRAVVRKSVKRTRRRIRSGLDLATTGWIHRGTSVQYRRFLRLSTLLAAHYRPRGAFHGSTLLLRATEEPDRERRGMTHDLGWSPFLDGPLEVVDVPTTHGGLIRPPAVTTTASAVVRAIRDVGA